MTRCFGPILLLAFFTATSMAGSMADSRQVAEAESVYAEVNDAVSIVATIDSGFFASYRGNDRAAWMQLYHKERKELAKRLSKLPSRGLSPTDAKAVGIMRTQLTSFSDDLAPAIVSGNCPDGRANNRNKDLDYASLRTALVACFVESAKNLSFEGKKINRQTALNLLHEVEQPERRKAAFMALAPLWQAINGNNQADSPYRRLIAMAAGDAVKNGSEVDRAAHDAGVDNAQVERWLEQILDAWLQVSSDQPVEPWNFSYEGAEAERLLASATPHESLLPINARFYQDLGADLKQLGVLYDIGSRPGEATIASTDFVTHGRMIRGDWQPTIVLVSEPFGGGGLAALNELVHENGHAVSFTAIRSRPAFVDWPGALLGEAFADVPSWSTYEPAWQRRYLGRAAPEPASLRALYGGVILDVAWSLFELRMLRTPATDPNVLWTEITNRYLHIIPHPELSWWAMREQLVDPPGYMINYGLGAVLTADIREHIRTALGPFDTGDPRWYGWLGEQLLRYGSERDTRMLLQDFLGRAVSPQALLNQIHRLAPSPK